MYRIHLDTDLGGDTDDACALAMLLGWPDVEITGITTTCDRGGIRAAYVSYLLELAGQSGIPVATGAGTTVTSLAVADPILNDARHWPTTLKRTPSPPGAALDLLTQSIERGATIVGIGAYTNLAVLEIVRAGSLGRVPVVLMGGWITPPVEGLPQWGPEMDWNVQWDTRAAEIVFAGATDLTIATLPATMHSHLRSADLPRLRDSGPLGTLLASQGEAHGSEFNMHAMGRANSALPDDLLNFQYDSVACAVAVDWPGAVMEVMTLSAMMHGDILRLKPNPNGRPARMLVDLDAGAFREVWLTAIEAAQR